MQGRTKEISFISNMQDDLKNNTGAFIPEAVCSSKVMLVSQSVLCYIFRYL